MRLRRFDTLSGRFILIVLLSLLLAQFVSILIFRLQAQSIFATEQLNRQLANGEHVLERLVGAGPDGYLRAEAVRELPGVLAAYESDTPWRQVASMPDASVTDRFARILEQTDILSVRAAIVPVNSYVDTPPETLSDPAPLTSQSFNHLYLSLEVRPGRWLNVVFDALSLRRPPIWPFMVLVSVSFLAVGIAAGIAANRVSQPLNALADASRTLGLGQGHVPLKVAGPSDLRQALSTFNAMGERLEATLESQKHILIAIGHDLRTPITALRVRTSLIQDEDERRNMERALDELERLTEAALEAGKESLEGEPMVMIDAAALVASVCEDVKDLGWDVAFTEVESDALIRGRPVELARALKNLLENAIRYGKRARVSFAVENGLCRIEIEDDGPGIPKELQDQVFEPLFRIEQSRSLTTGGHGLGLHIARKITRGHGGDIKLRNRQPYGLTAMLELPLCERHEACSRMTMA